MVYPNDRYIFLLPRIALQENVVYISRIWQFFPPWMARPHQGQVESLENIRISLDLLQDVSEFAGGQ